MDLKDKLAYYKSKTPQDESKPGKNIPPSLKALADEFHAEICQPLAPYLKISRTKDINPILLPVNDQQLNINLTFLDRDSQNTTFLMEECVFFDLETTGLMGGTGTFAFLLGFATIVNNTLKIDQYFLPDFGREYYLFKELNEFIPSYKTIVSYNGKSYDFPLLKSRYIMNHIEPVFSDMIHYDLLHFARRVWKDALPTCDLISIEENIINRYRKSDIPSWMIPQSYFDFLNIGTIHEIIRIIEHNYLDIITLAELTLILNRISNYPENEKNVLVLNRLAKLAYQQDSIQKFDQICASIENIAGRISHSLMMDKSMMHKRKNDWTAAAQIWEILIESGTYTFPALEELAKYYEHHTKDFIRAMEYTSRALKALDLLNQLETYNMSYTELIQRFSYRLERLKSKLSCL
jgi:uncharacterized protein YprB with RNaseH-like and TPR domain